MGEKIEFSEEDFPSNSIKSKQEKNEIEKPKNKRIVKGRAIKRKKSPWSNFLKSFLGDDSRSIGTFILYEVLVPAVKDTIIDMVSGGIEMAFRGDTRAGRSRRPINRGNGSIVSYSNYYREKEQKKPSERYVERSRSYRVRSRGIEEIIIEDRAEADSVLDTMVAHIEEYGVVSVDDLMDLVGFDSRDWTDTKWGWDDLHTARVIRARGGYMLDLPDPIRIEN